MVWLRSHPFAILFAVGGIIFLALAAAVRERTQPLPTQRTTAWTIAGTALPGAPAPALPQTMPNQPSLIGESIAFTAPPASTAPSSAAVATTSADFDALLALIAQSPAPSSPSSAAGSDSLLQLAYSFVPSGTYTAAQVQSTRTPDQQALYIYGNAAGAVIEQFENSNVNMAQNLSDWVNSRTDAGKTAAVEAIAASLTQAGQSLQALSGVPASAASDNAALAGSFEDAGQQLVAVAQTGSNDTAFINAIKTYDTTADTFTKNYSALADLFTLHQVTFSSTDAGSVFSFPANSGL